MATPSQIIANRENAQSSTGPRTESGKSTSSRNALTLGLYTKTDFVRPEEQDLYQEFSENLYTELDPEGLLEQAFAVEITGATWRLRRCAAAEAELDGFDESTDKTRRSIERARAHAHSVLNRSLNQFRKLQKERAHQDAIAARDRKRAGNHAFNALMASIVNPREPDLASNCMEEHASGVASAQTPRNAPCPCNSGKKYKHCCARTGNGWPSLTEAA